MTFRSLNCSLRILLLLALTAPLAFAADWPNYHGPAWNGISDETDWDTSLNGGSPNVLWRARLGEGFASIAVADGRAYTSGFKDGNEHYYCFNVETGDIVWEKSFPGKKFDQYNTGGTAATPSVDGEFLYIVAKDGLMKCYRAADGSEVWQNHLDEKLGIKPPQWGFSGSAVPYGDWILVDAGQLIAFNKSDGQVAWKAGDKQPGYSTSRVFELNGTKYATGFNAWGLEIFSLEGSRIAGFEWKTSYGVNAAMPIVKDDHIFIASGYNTGCALLQFKDNTLMEVYKNKDMRNQMNTCVLIKDHLYGFDESTLKCMDFRSGQVAWTKNGLGKGSLIASGDTLIILSEGGELVTAQANPEAFTQIANAQILGGTNWVIPVLANGKILARNNGGQMVCIDVSKK